jgi:hypothetical protein
MPRLTQARIDEIYRIKLDGDAGRHIHPDYPAIKAAERRFIDDPIVRVYVKTGEHPERLRFARPADDIEAACQWVAAGLLQHRLGRPVAIEYTTPPSRPRKKITHAFRFARRVLACHAVR